MASSPTTLFAPVLFHSSRSPTPSGFTRPAPPSASASTHSPATSRKRSHSPSSSAEPSSSSSNVSRGRLEQQSPPWASEAEVSLSSSAWADAAPPGRHSYGDANDEDNDDDIDEGLEGSTHQSRPIASGEVRAKRHRSRQTVREDAEAMVSIEQPGTTEGVSSSHSRRRRLPQPGNEGAARRPSADDEASGSGTGQSPASLRRRRPQLVRNTTAVPPPLLLSEAPPSEFSLSYFSREGGRGGVDQHHPAQLPPATEPPSSPRPRAAVLLSARRPGALDSTGRMRGPSRAANERWLGITPDLLSETTDTSSHPSQSSVSGRSRNDQSDHAVGLQSRASTAASFNSPPSRPRPSFLEPTASSLSRMSSTFLPSPSPRPSELTSFVGRGAGHLQRLIDSYQDVRASSERHHQEGGSMRRREGWQVAEDEEGQSRPISLSRPLSLQGRPPAPSSRGAPLAFGSDSSDEDDNSLASPSAAAADYEGRLFSHSEQPPLPPTSSRLPIMLSSGSIGRRFDSNSRSFPESNSVPDRQDNLPGWMWEEATHARRSGSTVVPSSSSTPRHTEDQSRVLPPLPSPTERRQRRREQGRQAHPSELDFPGTGLTERDRRRLLQIRQPSSLVRGTYDDDADGSGENADLGLEPSSSLIQTLARISTRRDRLRATELGANAFDIGDRASVRDPPPPPPSFSSLPPPSSSSTSTPWQYPLHRLAALDALYRSLVADNSGSSPATSTAAGFVPLVPGGSDPWLDPRLNLSSGAAAPPYAFPFSDYISDAELDTSYEGLVSLGARIGPGRPAGTPRWVVEGLNVESYRDVVSSGAGKGNAVDGRCGICLDDYESHELIMHMPCRHFLHKTCLEGWLNDHRNCPICRADVVVSRAEEEVSVAREPLVV